MQVLGIRVDVRLRSVPGSLGDVPRRCDADGLWRSSWIGREWVLVDTLCMVDG